MIKTLFRTGMTAALAFHFVPPGLESSFGFAAVELAAQEVQTAMAPVARPRVAVGTVTGRVSNTATGAPLSGAQVVVVGTQLGTLTGPDGRYSISGVPNGAQQIRVSMLGFGADTRPGVQWRPVAGQTSTAGARESACEPVVGESAQ